MDGHESGPAAAAAVCDVSGLWIDTTRGANLFGLLVARMTKTHVESWPIVEARRRRVRRLSAAVLEWRQLAEQRQYPRSLIDILDVALTREYQLGLKKRE